MHTLNSGILGYSLQNFVKLWKTYFIVTLCCLRLLIRQDKVYKYDTNYRLERVNIISVPFVYLDVYINRTVEEFAYNFEAVVQKFNEQ